MMSTPTYSLVVPSTGATVKFRPFLIKEEKALLIAQQSEDTQVMINTLKSVIKSCVQDNIDINKLAIFDLEYIFLQLRGKSVGETIDLFLPCDEDHGADNEKAKTKITLDINSINVEVGEGHTNKFKLFDDVGVVMKYPTVEVLKQLESLDENDFDKIFEIIALSIDYIYQGDQLFYANEQRKEELVSFVNNLSSEQFLKIQSFFETMPKLRKDVEYNCPVCGKHHKRTMEGIQSFF